MEPVLVLGIALVIVGVGGLLFHITAELSGIRRALERIADQQEQ